MQPSTLAKRVWFLLLVVIGLSYLYGLGHFPFVGPDEPRYADLRKRFLEGTKGNDGILLSAITVAIAAALGAAAASLVPIVALCIYAALRLGFSTYCKIAKEAP